MKITRDGSKLSINIDSGIGWTIRFDHALHSDADAEAWRVHLQTHADKQDEYRRNALERIEWANRDARGEISTERRRTAALRGRLKMMKNKNTKAKP
jgi:hypothetical protein